MLHAHAPTAEQHALPSAQRGHDAISHAGAPVGVAETLADEPGSAVLHPPAAQRPSDIVQSTQLAPAAPHALSPAPLLHVPLESQHPLHVWVSHEPIDGCGDALSAICIAPATAANAPATA
jgi:hypothetical protein